MKMTEFYQFLKGPSYSILAIEKGSEALKSDFSAVRNALRIEISDPSKGP
jgi:hypothetical protein